MDFLITGLNEDTFRSSHLVKSRETRKAVPERKLILKHYLVQSEGKTGKDREGILWKKIAFLAEIILVISYSKEL